MVQPACSVRERLIQNGLLELNKHGIQDFSVRRVASACGISCAAPYKHFEDKTQFIASIIEHVIKLWESYIPEVIAKYPNDLRQQIIEIGVRYVHFLVENSHFRSIIMLKAPGLDHQYATLRLRLRLSNSSRSLVYKYCEMHNIPDEVMSRKLFLMRSLIYGAALMFDNGEIEYTAANVELVRVGINREFDLP